LNFIQCSSLFDIY